MDDTRLIKKLYVQKNELIQDNDILIKHRNNLNNKIDTNQRLIRDIDKKIKNLKKDGKSPIITEHAILRYLERYKGIDIEKIKKEILPEHVLKQILFLKSGSFPINELIKIIVRNKIIVTVAPIKKGNK
jgi:hypothetical protein